MLQVDISKRRGDFSLELTLQAPRGVVALFGRSGCGKSTAVNLIAGLLQPDRGRICSDGTVLFDADAGIDMPADRRQIGYVFQDARLFPHYSVAGNLAYGLRRAASRPEVISLEAVIALLGLHALLERSPRQLSGGERQRVAIGRALLSQPRLLLLDEPLASLDRARREDVLPYLERLRDQLSIPMVYVSHQYDEVLRLATHVVLMDRGRVLAQGSVPEISMRPELRALVGSEAIGAVLEGIVTAVDPSGLAEVSLGNNHVQVDALGLALGQRVRLQLLARDLILSTEVPRGLSIRNRLQGVVTGIAPDDHFAALVSVDIGSGLLSIRVTAPAVAELALRPGLPVWVLIKSVTLQGHVFGAPAPQPASTGNNR